jgi:phage baseplate assembly protein gpV
MSWNPDLSRHIGKFYGKYSGVVTDNADATHRGVVMVRVPSVLGDLAVAARPCFPVAHYFVPPVGASVWVEFEAGDTSHALYSGAWYPEAAVPPEASAKAPDNRVIQTPSGHTVEFLDQDGEEKIVIRHKDNSFVALDKNGSVLISNKNGSHVYLNADAGELTVTEEHGNFIRMKSDGTTIVNSAGASVEMKDRAITVIAQDSVTLNARDVFVSSSTVSLGQNAMLSAVIGEKLQVLFDSHMHPTAVGPTGPPVVMMSTLTGTPASPLSQAVKLK